MAGKAQLGTESPACRAGSCCCHSAQLLAGPGGCRRTWGWSVYLFELPCRHLPSPSAPSPPPPRAKLLEGERLQSGGGRAEGRGKRLGVRWGGEEKQRRIAAGVKGRDAERFLHPTLDSSPACAGMAALPGAVPRMMRPGPGQNYPRTGFPLEGKSAQEAFTGYSRASEVHPPWGASGGSSPALLGRSLRVRPGKFLEPILVGFCVGFADPRPGLRGSRAAGLSPQGETPRGVCIWSVLHSGKFQFSPLFSDTWRSSPSLHSAAGFLP